MTGKDIIALAKKYLGYKGNTFCKAYGLNYVTYWCCIFEWYIFKEAKASRLFYSGGKVCNCRVAFYWCKANLKHVKMSDARPGDIVFFTWSGKGFNGGNSALSIDHIGFIERAGTSSVAYTLEGNTGATDPTVSTVRKRARNLQYILAIFRPKYTAQKASTKASTGKDASTKKSTKTSTNTTKGSKIVNDKAKYKVITKKGSNIRQGHNTNTKIIGALPEGSVINTTLRYGNWVKCRKGWVCIKGNKGTYLKRL